MTVLCRYYPRIEGLTAVNSVVAVSQSTARDVVHDYHDKVIKTAADKYQGNDEGDPVPATRGTIVNAIPNRLSRNLFKGPATPSEILAFRKRAKIWDSPRPMHRIHGVPYDFLLTVGTDYPYKNYDTFFAALDMLPDFVLERISVVMVGRGGMSGGELAQVKERAVLQTFADGRVEELNKRPEVKKRAPLRVHVLSYIDERDLPVVYSGMRACCNLHISRLISSSITIAALGLVFISSYEGFGLPLAEAMTSGTLAVATNASSLPEVGGPPEITFYVQEPRSAKEVSRVMWQMLRLSDEERQLRIKYAQKWVERYGGGPNGDGHGWDEMARLIAAHIRSKKHRRDECYVPYWTRKSG